MSRQRSRLQMWGWPAVIGSLSLFALITALLADGLGDIAASFILAVPVIVVIWCTVGRA